MPMTPQPHEIKRVPVGSERPARVHVIWHNRKFVGYTVRLDAGQDKWAALSPYGALVGETNTHIEALSLLAPDAEFFGSCPNTSSGSRSRASSRRRSRELAASSAECSGRGSWRPSHCARIPRRRR